jgi:hypothetical protein
VKKIIKYQLSESGTIPNYVSNGGYFPNGSELIGVSVEDDLTIPEEVEILDKSELVSHVTSLVLYKRNPIDMTYSVELTTEEKENSVNDWLDYVDMSDLD